jgi:ribosomal protein L7/L12
MRRMAHRLRVTDTTAKIMAIKLVRELTGFGLRESLDLVEAKAWFSVERDDATLARTVDEGSRSGVTFEIDPPLDAALTTSAGGVAGLHGEFAIRYRSGPNKIAAIKLVRELDPRFGLYDAKTLVESEGLVRVGITAAEAERIVRLFREIESVVDIELANATSTSVSVSVSVSAPSFPAPASPDPWAADKQVYGRPADDDDF